MGKRMKKVRLRAVLMLALMLIFGMDAMASEDDNSLYSLGILTEGATVSPEFSYDTWSYTVTVPGGTRELSLDPVPSSSSATISNISGTTLNDDGTGYVTITVQAGNGSPFTYELNVVSDGTVSAPEPETEEQTEPETEPVTEKATEPETEDPQYVRVHRDSIDEAANTISSLKEDITQYREKISLFTKIMYGLIALSIILLFIVINLLLKKKDLKAELNDYRSYGYSNSKKALKAQQKAQKKAEKAQQKNPSDPAAPYRPANAQPVSPTLQPAAPQKDTHAQAQQTYAGLDVQPQKSQKRAKNLPQYEQQPPVQVQQPAPYQGQPQQADSSSNAQRQPKRSGKKNDIEINMIDL